MIWAFAHGVDCYLILKSHPNISTLIIFDDIVSRCILPINMFVFNQTSAQQPWGCIIFQHRQNYIQKWEEQDINSSPLSDFPQGNVVRQFNVQ